MHAQASQLGGGHHIVLASGAGCGGVHAWALQPGDRYPTVWGWSGWLRGCARPGSPAWRWSAHGSGRWSWLRGCARLGPPARRWLPHGVGLVGSTAGLCTPGPSISAAITPLLEAVRADSGSVHAWVFQSGGGHPTVRGWWGWLRWCLRLPSLILVFGAAGAGCGGVHVRVLPFGGGHSTCQSWWGWLRGCARLGSPARRWPSHSFGWWGWLRGGARLGPSVR